MSVMRRFDQSSKVIAGSCGKYDDANSAVYEYHRNNSADVLDKNAKQYQVMETGVVGVEMEADAWA